MLTVKLEGLDQLTRNSRHSVEVVRQATAGAIYTEAEEVMTVSKETYCPVKSGALRSTGHVDPPEIHGNSISVTLGYGGPAGGEHEGKDVGYALAVHENLSAHHVVGQAKYLEAPLMERAQGMSTRIAAKVRGALGG